MEYEIQELMLYLHQFNLEYLISLYAVKQLIIVLKIHKIPGGLHEQSEFTYFKRYRFEYCYKYIPNTVVPLKSRY